MSDTRLAYYGAYVDRLQSYKYDCHNIMSQPENVNSEDSHIVGCKFSKCGDSGLSIVSSNSSNTLSTGEIVGIAVSCVAVVIIVGAYHGSWCRCVLLQDLEGTPSFFLKHVTSERFR